MKIQFLGGAGTVTGSKTLIETGKHRFLVDCGLFQGLKELRLRNWNPFPFNPREIDAVLLTHAHLDHSGYLPLLVKQGFRGRIHCSRPTRQLAELILLDSAHIQQEDADFANREGFSKHSPAKPLYDEKDVQATLERFETVGTGSWEKLPGGTRFRLTPSGHILGSTFVELQAEGKLIAFSGDLGRAKPLLYPPPEPIRSADFLVLESTYGDRLHEPSDPASELQKAVLDTLERGGKLLIPSFAVGRVQDLLHLLAGLRAASRIPEIPIYVDTPMGIRATEIFDGNPSWHRLSAAEVEAMWDIAKMLRSRQESIAVMRDSKPAIIIASSGMATGGRVLHHLASLLPHPRNTILLVGYQAAGTRGRLLRDGAKEVKMHGKQVPSGARILEIPGLSGHADQAEILGWLKGFERAPSRVFINHGEPESARALSQKLAQQGWECATPAAGDEFEL